MNIGVIGSREGWSSQSLSKSLQAKGHGGDLLELEEISMTGSESWSWKGRDLQSYDGLIIKKMGKSYDPRLQDELELLSYMERKGLRFFSSPSRLKGMISRVSCTLRLLEAGIPMPPTFIGEDPEQALSWLESMGRVVIKPLYSTKARGMQIFEAGKVGVSVLREHQEQYGKVLYLQKMVELDGRDHGLVFLAGKYLGAYSRVGDGRSWNTTTNSGGKYEAYDAPGEIVALAEKAQGIFGLDFTSVDVAITKDGPIVFEVSAFGGYRGLYETSGIDASDLLTDHVVERLS